MANGKDEGETGNEGKNENGKEAAEARRRPPTMGEQVFSWCKALAVLVPAIIACYAAFFKGEPVAEKTWDTLRAQVNKQSDSINKLHLRIVYFQAQSETQTAIAIQQKLDQLQKKYDALVLEKKTASAAVAPIPTRIAAADPPPPPPPPPPTPKCRRGQVEAGGRCQWVPPAVRAKLKAQEVHRVTVEGKLRKEKALRTKLEERELVKARMQEQAPQLKALPKGLEDAARGE